MRLLHTSDWHLGRTQEGVSREEDHALFLAWLLDAITTHQVDVLLVAGDVFDHSAPSAESQRAYYRFLAQASQTRLKQVVVIGGNHDSASRLDAPREILGALNVHVVGGFPGEDALERCLVPVGTPPQLVVAALPYVHEYKLGVRGTDLEPGALLTAMKDQFQTLYSKLADLAVAMAPEAALVAMGHLTCLGVEKGDAPFDIHMVGSIGGLPAQVFDMRFQHVALGHIHRSYRVAGSQAWYSGSPIPMGLKEMTPARRVLLVDVDKPGVPAVVTPLQLPVWRELLLVRGSTNAVMETLGSLSSAAPLPALVQVEVEGGAPGVERLCEEALEKRVAAGPRPVLVGVRRLASAPVMLGRMDAPPVVPGRDNPEEVFRLLCSQRGEVVDDALLAAFREVLEAAAREEDAP